MHKYCPNFTSLVGAQYLQRIAVLLADGASPTDPRPRAYFPTEEYADKIDDDEMLVVGQFLYATSCTLFSHLTKIIL